jgi:hypothetical protein
MLPHSQHATQARQQVCIPHINQTGIGKASALVAAEASAAPHYTRKNKSCKSSRHQRHHTSSDKKQVLQILAASKCIDLKPGLLR